MGSLLLLGFLIGIRHALDADHLAAVASIATQQSTFKSTIRHGAIWGLGHTTTLFIFGSVVIWADTVIPQQLADYLEIAVGFMLIALGLDVIRRVIKERVHYHFHQHDIDPPHLHAHSHLSKNNPDALTHQQEFHQHQHNKFPYRTLYIGLMHGMAGSAALILLTMETVTSLWVGLAYMLLFGLGSMLGMVVISFIIAIPLRKTNKELTWMHNGLQLGIGGLTLGLGVVIVYQLI